jgi:glucokinase
MSNKLDYKKYGITKAGVAVCGPVEPKTGVIDSLPNVPFEPFSLKEELEANLGLDVVVGNDANVAAYAESRIGFGKGKDIVEYVTISTGIGAGLVINGQIVEGFKGMAQEIGHMRVLDSEFEKLCSGTGIVLLCKKRGVEVESAREFFEKVVAKDESVLKVYNEWLEILSDQIANMVYFIAPEAIVFDGGVMKSKDIFFDEFVRRVESKIYPRLVGNIAFKITKLDQDITVVGAGLLGI